MKQKIYTPLFTLLVLTPLLLSACSQEADLNGSKALDSISLHISLPDSKTKNRTMNPGVDAENKIELLTLFVFNPEGTREALLTYTPTKGVVAGDWESGKLDVSISHEEMGGDLTSLKTIYAVANYQFDPLTAPGTIADLLNTQMDSLPQPGHAIPMSGMVKNLFAQNNSALIQLERSVAKFRLTVSTNSHVDDKYRTVAFRLLNRATNKGMLLPPSGKPDASPVANDTVWISMPNFPINVKRNSDTGREEIIGPSQTTGSCYMYEQDWPPTKENLLRFEIISSGNVNYHGTINPVDPYLICRNMIYDVKLEIYDYGAWEKKGLQCTIIPWQSDSFESDIKPEY